MSTRSAAAFASAFSHHVQLARALPPRLLRFIARYPPASILPAGTDVEASRTPYQIETPNPFRHTKHPVTGRWHNPKYSLRRQAELVRLARENGVYELLPECEKGNEARTRKRVEHGLRVKGTGIGQRVKGHVYERRKPAQTAKRREAMLKMPALIAEWKKVGPARWRKFPK